MDTNYRPFVNTPGEPIVSPILVGEAMMRLLAAERLTGLDQTQWALSTVCSTPVPRYLAGAGERRWAHINPAALWHPLFWLPPSSYQRRWISFDDSTAGTETDDLWVARVLIEMTAAGLYHEPDGTWADILAFHGLDVDNPDHVARISRWQAGEPDPILDAVTLESHLDFGDEEENWSLFEAVDTVEALVPVAVLITADDLTAQIEAMAAATDLADEDLATGARTIAAMACQQFGTALPGEAAWWGQVLDQWDGDRSSLLAGVLPQMTQRLSTIGANARELAQPLVEFGEEIAFALAEANANPQNTPVAAAPAPARAVEDDPWADSDPDW